MARTMVRRITEHLCIGCWFGECGGKHPDPDLTCPCCLEHVPVETR